MIGAWCLLALRPGEHPDIAVVGTDPILSVTIAGFWKIFRPRTKIVHWCFDLYPEAAIADGLIAETAIPGKLLRFFLRGAYKSCSAIVDIGPCMRKALMQYKSTAQRHTVVPWALEEPQNVLADDAAERKALFGRARLALLYSGSFGRAHSFNEILDLAVLLEAEGAKFVFSIRGNREAELKDEATRRSSRVDFVNFAPQSKLRARLACADVHIVSLRPEWTGTVVPSKFFGALAVGRPVLFCGSHESSLAEWIRTFNIGWTLTADNLADVAAALRSYAHSIDEQREMKRRCWTAYRDHFSKSVQLDLWNKMLTDFLPVVK